VDLNDHTIDIETPSASFYRKYMGGSALGTYYLLKHTPPGAHPLSPENTLVLATGVVTGAPVAGQSRITATAKSPLTGGIGDSQSGGYFPAEFKFSGFDALVLHGRSAFPVYLWILEGDVEIRSADHLMGKTTRDVEQILKDDLEDPRIQILQTGIAGENEVRYASLISMANRANGRTGMGAIMGSKNLKAVVVRGTQKPEIHNPEGLKGLARSGAKHFPESDVYAMGVHGTAEVIAYQNEVGGLPTHNWDRGAFEGWEALDGRTMTEKILVRRDTCFACPIRCKRVVEHEASPYQFDPDYGGPEYETLSTFGSYCDVDDLEAVAYANQLCNMYGLDTISCGATIAWAMDAFEKGMLTRDDTGGIELCFGNAEAMVETVRLIAFREGIGDLLAEGSARAARRIGCESEDLTVTVKNQELPAHMPQVKPSLGLIYAVNPFGADHQSSEHDPSFQGYPERMEQLGLKKGEKAAGFSEEMVNFALTTQYLYSAMDSVSVCQFVYGPAWQLYDTQQLIHMIQHVTGWELDVEELLEIGARRLNLMQTYNAREGFTRKDDQLPKKLFKPLQGGASEGYALSPPKVERVKNMYYQLAGWDEETAKPTDERLTELGLAWVLNLPELS
jgi:aldehyde:ferredoxin oxidoreductase